MTEGDFGGSRNGEQSSWQRRGVLELAREEVLKKRSPAARSAVLQGQRGIPTSHSHSHSHLHLHLHLPARLSTRARSPHRSVGPARLSRICCSPPLPNMVPSIRALWNLKDGLIVLGTPLLLLPLPLVVRTAGAAALSFAAVGDSLRRTSGGLYPNPSNTFFSPSLQ
ncbi:solute carrier family 13 member 5-like [Arapaima gigas]